MNLYLDTSALVKLFVDEDDRDMALTAVQNADLVNISSVGYPEARSALARRFREGRLNDEEYKRAIADLNHDLAEFNCIDVSLRLAYRAGDLADIHALRGFDAIHLASALLVKDVRGVVRFLAFDNRLNAAAEAESLTLFTSQG